jgi:hypothetical protein
VASASYVTWHEFWQLQGDQIGRIFTNWAIVLFGRLLKKCIKSPKTGMGYILPGKSYVFTLTKQAWATLWANFFTNSSGTDVMITIFCDF